MKTCSKCYIPQPISLFPKTGGQCKSCKRLYMTIYRNLNRDKWNINVSTRRREIRKEVVVKYGHKCKCCGESRYEFLSIDHVNNDGAKERKEYIPDRKGGASIGTSHEFIMKLYKEDVSPKYQLLCFNCNHAKHVYKVCPHQSAD